ncbi:hypothetical protein J8J27_25910, partial [Mycobacterium tuberculosis]|nr:hypothetical protein [Mycobacterium tuberculosis]
MLLFAEHPADVVPNAVLQGILFVIGFGLYDGRLGMLVGALRDHGQRRKGLVGEILVLVGTAAATLGVGATTGLALGLAASVVL